MVGTVGFRIPVGSNILERVRVSGDPAGPGSVSLTGSTGRPSTESLSGEFSRNSKGEPWLVGDELGEDSLASVWDQEETRSVSGRRKR
jgi:hypothetical protein